MGVIESVRINKFLTQANVCSRREADRLISAGRVRIGDRVAKLGDKISQDDTVFVGGKAVRASVKKIYLAFHKPVGVICTTDAKSKNNIVEYIKYKERVYPIGRLDVATSGLILLTNDGAIVNSILKGAAYVEKEYEVEVHKPVNETFLKTLERGGMLDGHRTLPARTKQLGPRRFSIVVVQGKRRQIRRMCEKLGYEVMRLTRLRIGTITLEGLKVGAWREVTEGEIKKLLHA